MARKTLPLRLFYHATEVAAALKRRIADRIGSNDPERLRRMQTDCAAYGRPPRLARDRKGGVLMGRGNSCGSGVKKARKRGWDAFDKLPADVRQALANAAVRTRL
jgi:hypothetical protein